MIELSSHGNDKFSDTPKAECFLRLKKTVFYLKAWGRFSGKNAALFSRFMHCYDLKDRIICSICFVTEMQHNYMQHNPRSKVQLHNPSPVDRKH